MWLCLNDVWSSIYDFRRRFCFSSYNISRLNARSVALREKENCIFLALVPESPTLMCSNWRIQCALQDSIWTFHGSMETGHQFRFWQNMQPWKKRKEKKTSTDVKQQHLFFSLILFKRKRNLDHVLFQHNWPNTVYDINMILQHWSEGVD